MPKKSLTLKVVKADGTDLCTLPHKQNLALSLVRSDVGSISFDYPLNGKNADKLGKYVELRVLQGGTELRGCRYLLDDTSDDEASEEGKGSPNSWTGRTWGDAMFDKTVVFPAAMGAAPTYTATDGANPGPNFVNQTPGYAVKWLIDQAQARGCFPNLTYDFDEAQDSMGTPWPLNFTKQYEVGSTKYSQVLVDLRDLGLIEYEFVGRQLRMYVQGFNGHMENNLSDGPNPVVFNKGKDLASAPISRGSRDTISAILVQGEGGIYAQGVAGASDAPFRVEGYFSESGVTDMGALQWIGGQRLNSHNHDSSEHTYELGDLSNSGTPLPWDDFYLGDWVWGRTGPAAELLRIAQLTLNQDDEGGLAGSVVLGDLIEAKAVALSHKIDRLEQSIVTKATGSGTVNTLDATTPKPPVGFSLTTDSYQDSVGKTSAIIFASWAQVTQNTDNTPYVDAGGYRLQWKRTADGNWGDDWTTLPDAFQTTVSDLPLGESIDVRLRAYDLSGHLSTWVQSTIVTSKDTVAPAVASAPTVDTTKFAGVARIIWDGKDYLGGAMSTDFAYVEVHVGNAAGFATSDATLVDTILTGGGVAVYAGDLGVVRYVKLISVDNSGNKSAVSAEVAFTIRKLVDTDAIDAFVTNRLLGPQVVDTANIKDLAVGTAQMQNLSVVNAKIGTLAVNDANIGSVNVGKLAAGLLTADVTVSARIKTANTGLRAEMDGAGFHVFNSAGTEVGTLGILGGVPALLMVGGTIATGLTGARIRLEPTGTYGGMVQIYSGLAAEGAPGQLYGGTTLFGLGIALVSPTIPGQTSGNTVSNLLMYPGSATYPNGLVYMTGTVRLQNNLEMVGAIGTSAAGLFLGGAVVGGGNTISNVTLTANSVTSAGEITINGGNSLTIATPPGSATAANAVIGASGRINKFTSSKRFKRDIKALSLDEALELFKLEAVTYRDRAEVKEDALAGRHHGFISEQAEKAGLHPFVTFDEKGRSDGFQYVKVIPALLKIVEHHQKRLAEVEQEMATLRELIT